MPVAAIASNTSSIGLFSWLRDSRGHSAPDVRGCVVVGDWRRFCATALDVTLVGVAQRWLTVTSSHSELALDGAPVIANLGE